MDKDNKWNALVTKRITQITIARLKQSILTDPTLSTHKYIMDVRKRNIAREKKQVWVAIIDGRAQ